MTVQQFPDAPCQTHKQPDLWHEPRGMREAKAICRRACPLALQTACLQAAIDHELPGSRWGVWGGLDPDERAVIAEGSVA